VKNIPVEGLMAVSLQDAGHQLALAVIICGITHHTLFIA
jgi:hypothetical protein